MQHSHLNLGIKTNIISARKFNRCTFLSEITSIRDRMAPTPQEPPVELQIGAPEPGDAPLAPDAVVITGMSGMMPDCHNLDEFAEKLYNKENLVKKCDPTKARWELQHPELSGYYGTTPGWDRFDAQFFMIHHGVANVMDPMSRKLLENSYQAIFDAGISPAELGTYRVGVYTAVGFTESEKIVSCSPVSFGLVGNNRAMMANRVSYWLNAKGPSITVDSGCCGSLAVFEKAYRDMATGVCDAAIVGASKVLLHPYYMIHYDRELKQNKDGKTKCYDVNADGPSCSEATNVFLLQKYKHSKRVYAHLCLAKTQYGLEPLDSKGSISKLGYDRDPEYLAEFLRDFYAEARVPPSLVDYMEGFGTANPVPEKFELQAIEKVFCKDRSSPLLIGSVMSNIGYTECVSGSAAIVKLLLAYQKGELAATINCDSPRQDIDAMRDGRIRVVTDHRRFRHSYAAVNGLSFTGVNGHALLGGHFKLKDRSRYQSEIPHLVTISGRMESAVQKVIDTLKSHEVDAEEIALLHNIHKYRINGHLARGFGIFSMNENNETITHKEKSDYYDDTKRPLWFVYSGMGSQWAGMGAQLMRIPIFAAAIQRCQKVLEPKGLDLIHILTSPDEEIYDNILHSFVGIAAVQIGLTDVLTAIGLVPDKIIGHSVGELGCAYADGCLTAEEMILSAYCRGLVSIETPFIVGSMAAVGLGFDKISGMLPPEIEVACHNGPESSTISGPANVMREFVAQLTAKGIFAKEVPCSNIAYHSRYIAKAGPGLLKYLSEVIDTPRLRSDRWVSTSVPQSRWDENAAKYSSAQYHTNNLLNPVLFEETARLIPNNAVVVEIAPHGLLQAILKRSLPSSCKHVPLTRRGHDDNTLFLLEAIGTLYMNGYEADIAALYPRVEFPVSTETRSLSHLVEWVHSDQWKLCCYIPVDHQYSAIYKPIITIYDDEFRYLVGHVIDGTRVFPFAAAIVAVWDALAMTLSKARRTLPVQLRNILFYTQPRLTDTEALHLTVALQRGSGHFEVSYEHGLVAEGTIIPVFDNFVDIEYVEKDSLVVTTNDVYKLLNEKGYDYKGEFRSIFKTDESFEQAQLIWNDNWVTLIDGLFQLNALRSSHSAISEPRRIKTLSISPKTHFAQNSQTNFEYIDVKLYGLQEMTRCGSVIMEKITFLDKPYIPRQSADLKALQFFPFFLQEDADICTTLYVFLQIVMENLHESTINIFDVTGCNKTSIVENIKELLTSPPEIKYELIKINKHNLLSLRGVEPKPHVLILNDLLSDKQVFQDLFQCLTPNTFIVSLGVETEELYPSTLYRPVCVRGKEQKRIELALWRPSTSTSTTALTVRNSSEIDFLQATCSNLPPRHRIFVLSSNPPPLGLKNVIKQQKRLCNRNINVAIINHTLAEDQELDDLPNFDLTYNILSHGQWGGEYYMALPKNTTTEQTVALKSTQIGKIDSLKWMEVPEVTGGIAVKVYYAGLNAYDTKRARAEISTVNENDGYGQDFSGITDRGDRVFGVVRNGAICSKINACPELLWPVPEHWDLEDAATVPLPYVQAFYCLAIKTKIRKGQKILIHSGAGALGQALISISLGLGLEVFTTVGDIRKKLFLTQLFPELKANHIGNSRDLSFSDMILNATKGEGCDLVINSLKGELKNASLNCCNGLGTVIDTVQVHTRENFSYGMFNMTKNRSYMCVDFAAILENDNLEDLQRLRALITEGITLGYVRPLSRVTYSPHEAPRAFRLLAASNHRGRVLLRIGDVDIPGTSPVQPRLPCSPDHQQLLISNEDVLSLLLADRLINRGARRLRIYLPRPSGYLNVKKSAWRKRGVTVDTVFNQTLRSEDLVEFLHNSTQTGIVDTLFYIARDMCTSNNDQEATQETIIESLDTTSRKLFPSVKCFAVISERQFAKEICRDRSFYGLPSLSLQLQSINQFDEIERIGHEASSGQKLKPQVAVEVIERALCSRQPVVFGYAQSNPRRTLLEEIALLPGISITSATDQRSTLEQVGLDQGRAQELCYLLEEKFNIVLPKESLPHMTINQLKKLQEHFNDASKEEPGLAAYFSEIDVDEMVEASELVLMTTLVHCPNMRPDAAFNIDTYLCIVPGIEGHHKRFEVLCERLKLLALVLKPSIDDLDANIPDMAQRLVNVMTRRMAKSNSFYLLGYELGIFVVLEMAAILESYGLTGTVYCLGGTPDDIKSMLEFNIKGMTDDQLQDAILLHLTSLVMDRQIPALTTQLQNAKNWLDKVETCVRTCRGQALYTSQFIRSYLKAAYNKINLIRNHKARPYSLRSKIVVIRTELSSPSNLKTMRGFSQQELAVHELKSSLSQAPKNLQCSAIINEYLAPEVQESFENLNHCDPCPMNLETVLYYK